MSALERRAPAATTAAIPGKEAEKMVQRFHRLDAGNRATLLEMALGMIDRQQDTLLPPREREAKKLVDRITHCLDLIQTAPDQSAIGPLIWRDIVAEDQASLAALDIGYFGS